MKKIKMLLTYIFLILFIFLLFKLCFTSDIIIVAAWNVKSEDMRKLMSEQNIRCILGNYSQVHIGDIIIVTCRSFFGRPRLNCLPDYEWYENSFSYNSYVITVNRWKANEAVKKLKNVTTICGVAKYNIFEKKTKIHKLRESSISFKR